MSNLYGFNTGRPPQRRRRDRSVGAFVAWFVFCLVVSLAWLGFLVWAIYELVIWVTSK